MPTDYQYRRDIVRFGEMLHSLGFIAATDGNLSVRLDENRILVTPTGMSKGMMTPSDLVVVDMNGRKLKGKRQVTSEIGMHLLIYRMRPDVRGIVHAHPRPATGFAAAGMALNQPYGTPGTPELAATLEPLIPQYDAILMANHGVVTYGPDLQSAYMKMETVEHFAQIALVTHVLGQQKPLACEDLEKLVAARSRYLGVSSAAPMPVYAEMDEDSSDESPIASSKPLRSHAIPHRRGTSFQREN